MSPGPSLLIPGVGFSPCLHYSQWKAAVKALVIWQFLASYQYSRREAGQGWTLKHGNLERGILWRPQIQYWGGEDRVFPYISSAASLEDGVRTTNSEEF